MIIKNIKMENKTAVEWLVEQIENNRCTIFFERNLHPFEKYVEQAKAMEKEQIKDAYIFGIKDEYVIGSQRYYNETFKN